MKLSIAFTNLENALLAQVSHRSATDDDSPGRVLVALPPETAPCAAEARQSDAGSSAVIGMTRDGLRIRQAPSFPPVRKPDGNGHEAADELHERPEGIDERSLLSPREIAVLELLSEGQSNKYIARELDIAEPTVKCHVKSILRKLGVRNRFEAAMWVLRARGQLLP